MHIKYIFKNIQELIENYMIFYNDVYYIKYLDDY